MKTEVVRGSKENKQIKHSKSIKALKIFDFDRWSARVEADRKVYDTEIPFPHIILENFLELDAARQAEKEFPAVKSDGWIHYLHVNEKKHGLNKMELLPPFIQKVILELNSDQFVSYLEKVTGIKGLIADPQLEGGGLHQSMNGGYLNIHADFTVHPHKRNWRRRVNVLVYLNENWKEEYGGHLELWTRDMKKCEVKSAPLFNRCVIFNTDEDSFHGLPEPITCPEDESRKSLALYYFTEEEVRPNKVITNYKARPGDGLKSIPIYLDKKLVAVYSNLKSFLGINDDFVSKVLGFFRKK